MLRSQSGSAASVPGQRPRKMTKYVLVSGGVISGVGKGVISSSIGMLLKSQGLRVTSIKIDPYLNIDAGTFSPYEHGEVYVLDDGGECDLDLGNYERFLDVTLTRDSNITTGKIYKSVMDAERRGDYLGKTVQVVPHITNEIQDWIERVAKKPTDGSDEQPDVCIIELGGTVGDIESMPFIEAFRQFQFRVGDGPGSDRFLSVHVSLVPETTDGEQKTKPTQHSIRELRGLGISPDIIICRSKNPLNAKVKAKLANFCHVTANRVISVHDCSSIYRVPLLLESQGVLHVIKERMKIDRINTGGALGGASIDDEDYDGPLAEWKDLADRYEALAKSVKIVLVGKYTELSDAYASVVKALRHACVQSNRRLDLLYVEAGDLEAAVQKDDPERYHAAWGRLCTGDGILVPGGFGNRGIEGKIAAIHWARTRKVPFLGICLGFQMAVIEYARNVLGWEGANSTEADPDTPHPVIVDMPEISQTILGGTMRLGKRRTVFNRDCVTKTMYGGGDFVDERHRHRFEVNPKNIAAFEEKGLHFVGKDVEGERMEILELADHPYFAAAQFHPEFLSRPLKAHPMFFGFILASCGKLETWLRREVTSPSGKDRPASPVVVSPTSSPTKGGQGSARKSSDGFSAFESVPSPLKYSATASDDAAAAAKATVI